MTIPVKSLVAALVPVDKDALTLGPTKDPNSPNAQSPVGGDHAFYTYCVPGARFQAQDGTTWDLETVTDFGTARIRNLWYPREERTISVVPGGPIPGLSLRETIDRWIEPVDQAVPRLESKDAK
jgi:hypothetical protein